jgi:hypothetical protein
MTTKDKKTTTKKTNKTKKTKNKDDEVGYYLSPKGCLCYALNKVCPGLLTDDQQDLVWMVFEDTMRQIGYVEDEKK